MDKKVEKKFLVPKDGLKVFNPKTKTFLSKDGEVVSMSPYWRRRLADKDFKKVEDVVAAKVKKVELPKEVPSQEKKEKSESKK